MQCPGFNMYLWNSLWKKLYSANNIYYSEGLSSIFLDGINQDTAYSFESSSDNYFNKNDVIAIIQPINGVANCLSFKNTDEFNKGFINTTKSKHVSISGYEFQPNFKNSVTNDFSLDKSSKLIDLGILIPGFNTNFNNNAPDIGAIEYNLNPVRV